MTATVLSPNSPNSPNSPTIDELRSSVSGVRRFKNRMATAWMSLSVAAAVVPLGFIVLYLVQKGMGVFSVDFLTKSIPASGRVRGPGMGPAVAGTLVITATAAAMSIPLGILGAIYLNEYGSRSRLAKLVRLMADVMTGVPSIVMGLFIYTVWVLRFGLSGFAGSLALACLMLPIIIRSTEEMLRLVPDELRHASYALGNSTWRTIASIVVPAAAPGIVSGVMLAVARAAGETAPLLFCVGVSSEANWNVFGGPTTALPAQIFANAQTPFIGAQERAWGAAFTLVLVVFVFTVAARIVSSRFARARGG